MKNILLTCVVLLISINTYCQNPIARKFSSLIVPTSVNPALNNKLLLTGITYSSLLGVQGTLIAVDSQYNILNTALPGSGNIRSYGAYQRGNGNIVQLSTADFSKFWFTEYDSSLNFISNTIWQDPLVTGSCYSSFTFNQQRSNFLFNQSLIAPQSSSNSLLVCFDTSGALLWQKVVVYQQGFLIKKLLPTSDNGYFLLGQINDSSGYKDMLVIKTDSVGNILWDFKAGTSANIEEASAITELTNGEIVLAGKIETDTGNYHITPSEILLIKLDIQRSIVWSQKIMYQTWSFPDALMQHGNEIVLAGHFYNSIGASVNTINGEGLIYTFNIASNFIQGKNFGKSEPQKHYEPVGFFSSGNQYGVLAGRLGYHSDSFLFTFDSTWSQPCLAYSITPLVTPIILNQSIPGLTSSPVSVLSSYTDTVSIYASSSQYSEFCQPLGVVHNYNPQTSCAIKYAAGKIIISFPEGGKHIINVYDIASREITINKQTCSPSEMILEESNLTKGMYLITIRSGNQIVCSSKFIVD